MATFTLTALPGHHEQEPGRAYKMTVIELLGACLGRSRTDAKNVAEIAAAVKTFGDEVAKQHPEVSFMVSVSVVKGSRASQTASMPPTAVTGSARKPG